jgi:hypothetical protein
MNAHTPGPWFVDRRDSGCANAVDILTVRGGDCLQIASITNEDEPLSEARLTDEDRANAHLIAAAPDLLAACEAAYIALPIAEHNDKTLATLRAAIAKAVGYA